MGRISDDLLLNPKTNTNGANNLTEWRNFDGTRHSEKLNQITLADMELIPNTAYVYFEFSGTSNVGGNELKVIRNVHVPLKQQNGRLVQFLYNENREVVAEKDYSGNIIRYIRGLGLISSDSENAKTYYHYVCDEQGSVSRIIRGEDKENGAAAQDKVSDRVLNHYEYDAFGNTISCEERVANRFRYQTSYGKSSGKYDTTADFLTNIENRNGKFYTDKATIDKIGQVEARGEDFSPLNKRIMSSRASTEGGTSVVYKYSDELGTKYLIHEVTDARGYIIHRDFDAVRISSGQLINKGHQLGG